MKKQECGVQGKEKPLLGPFSAFQNFRNCMSVRCCYQKYSSIISINVHMDGIKLVSLNVLQREHLNSQRFFVQRSTYNSVFAGSRFSRFVHRFPDWYYHWFYKKSETESFSQIQSTFGLSICRRSKGPEKATFRTETQPKPIESRHPPGLQRAEENGTKQQTEFRKWQINIDNLSYIHRPWFWKATEQKLQPIISRDSLQSAAPGGPQHSEAPPPDSIAAYPPTPTDNP